MAVRYTVLILCDNYVPSKHARLTVRKCNLKSPLPCFLKGYIRFQKRNEVAYNNDTFKSHAGK